MYEPRFAFPVIAAGRVTTEPMDNEYDPSTESLRRKLFYDALSRLTNAELDTAADSYGCRF